MAIAPYLVDKSAYGRLQIAEVHDVLQPLLARAMVAICGTVALELLFSAQSPDDHAQIELAVDTAFEWLPTEDSDFGRAREVSSLLAATGRHRAVGIAELLTAAVAERHQVTVLHYDHDYDLVSEITGQPTEWVVPRGTVN